MHKEKIKEMSIKIKEHYNNNAINTFNHIRAENSKDFINIFLKSLNVYKIKNLLKLYSEKDIYNDVVNGFKYMYDKIYILDTFTYR